VLPLLALTKPRISPALITVATMFVADPLAALGDPLDMLGGYPAAGNGAINHSPGATATRMARTCGLRGGVDRALHGLRLQRRARRRRDSQLAITVNVLAAALALSGCSATCSSTRCG
jgi:hypothetical protein